MPLPTEVEPYRIQVEEALKEMFHRSHGPELLMEAMAYSLFAGGKRIRPVLTLAVRDLFAPKGPDALPAACALEYIHTYSLIHDDLPAMDDDSLRRGRPTSHVRYGEAVAILAGDALLTEAFTLMAKAYGAEGSVAAIRGIAEVAEAAGSAGMVGGQVRDMADTGRDLAQPDLEEIHRMKTGALLRASVRVGAILGGADEAQLADLTAYGQKLGLAFQVADDLLDVLADSHQLGKSAGKDKAQGKTTYADLLGVAGGRNYVRRLVDEACLHLEAFGERARPLVALAQFIADSVGATAQPA